LILATNYRNDYI